MDCFFKDLLIIFMEKYCEQIHMKFSETFCIKVFFPQNALYVKKNFS